MSDFELFDQVFKDEEKIEATQVSSCNHTNTIVEKGIEICIDCGEEIEEQIENVKEWRYYGQGDSKHHSDPNRVQARKVEEKGIFKDVENMKFPDVVIREANKLYLEVTRGDICRGKSRKSIIFACIFHAFKIKGKFQTYDNLLKIFHLDKKSALKGMKYVNLKADKTSKIRTTYITPENLIEEIMKTFDSPESYKNEVIELYKKIKNKSSNLNRARPQSVASAIVYYWICINNKGISLKEFAKKVNLSGLTIGKITQEINEILSKN